MIVRGRPVIVVLGMMSRVPVGGLVWGTLQYLLGFERLGFRVFYAEEHGSTPRMFLTAGAADPWPGAAAFVASVMRRAGLSDRWAYRVIQDDRCYGMSSSRLRDVYASADYVVNLHGATWPLPEAAARARYLYLDTDPVDVQARAAEGHPKTLACLSAHDDHFTWALNYGRTTCRVPRLDQFLFHTSPPPIVIDIWQGHDQPPGSRFTTIGNWRQDYRHVSIDGEIYSWSKHHEFLKVIDLPTVTGHDFELSLSSCEAADRALLEAHGWHVRDALSFSTDLDAYRTYIQDSLGEFTVAKDQNVRLRSGWFSERSASYLATGRPVVTQETGFSEVLPTGEGLLAFSTPDEAAAAVDAVATNPRRHGRAAAALAREYFDYRVVLPALLERIGAGTPRRLIERPRDIHEEIHGTSTI